MVRIQHRCDNNSINLIIMTSSQFGVPGSVQRMHIGKAAPESGIYKLDPPLSSPKHGVKYLLGKFNVF